MTKLTSVCVAVALATLASSAFASQTVQLTVEQDQVLRELNHGIFGINHRFSVNGYGSFDPKTHDIRPEFRKLYTDAGFQSLRYPGGTISNLFAWKKTIGPKENRSLQIHGIYNSKGQKGIEPNFGLSEVADFTDSVGSEIIYVYGFGRGSAQDAADLIEYLNAPVGSNPNGGVAWAEVRSKYGHSEPYNVRFFEIGNENNHHKGVDGNLAQTYWLDYIDKDADYGYVFGGVSKPRNQYAVKADNWNQVDCVSDGTKNQVRYMRYANPNPGAGPMGDELDDSFSAVERGSVSVYVNNVEWKIVDDLKTAGKNDSVVQIDYRDGSIHFGDGVHGAIPNKGAKISVSYDVKREGYIDIVKAMKSTVEQINNYYKEHNNSYTLEFHPFSSFETPSFVSYMHQANADDLYEGLTIHPYTGDDIKEDANDPTVYYKDALLLGQNSTVDRVQHLVDLMPKGKVPVISEYGICCKPKPMIRAQGHAIYVAKQIMDYVNAGSPYIQKHCLVDWYSQGADSLGPTQQAVIQAVAQEGTDIRTGNGDVRFFSTPSAHAIQMYAKNFGTKQVKAEFDKQLTLDNGVRQNQAIASVDEQGNTYVAVVNTDPVNELNLNIDVDGQNLSNKKISVQKLSGSSVDAENSLENPENVKIEYQDFTNQGNDVEIKLAPHSFYMIKINK